MFRVRRKPDLTALRKRMDEALKAVIVQQLRTAGFQGSYPHFRRLKSDGVDLLTFQFNKYGGSFVVEIATGPRQGCTLPFGKFIEARHLTAWDVPTESRTRIAPHWTLSADYWFRFADGRIEACVHRVEKALPRAEAWWKRQTKS